MENSLRIDYRKVRGVDPLIRFWTNVKRKDDTSCWPWDGTVVNKRNPHGLFWDGKRHIMAYRFMWEITYGEIPEGLLVRHDCDNGMCVNPKHLRLGTQADNMRDRMLRGKPSGPRRRISAYDRLVTRAFWDLVKFSRESKRARKAQ